MSDLTVASRLEALQATFEAGVEALADEVRTQHVEPFCRKHRWEYLAGNGTYVFYGTGKLKEITIGNEDDIILDSPEHLCEQFRAMFQLLDLEVGHNTYLGYYVGDVRLTDEPKGRKS
jgi:hypothetical protein